MRKLECTKCGTEAPVTRGTYNFKDVGLRNVVLRGIEVAHCPNCGNQDAILPRVNELMRVLALAVIGKPYRLNGEEVRFLRKFLGMTAEKFGQFLHVDKTTISKWENEDDPVGAQSDLLIRAMTLALDEGLRSRIDAALREFPKIRWSRRRVGIEVKAETMEYAYA